MPAGEWDVFISHASEDKETVARPLAEELRRRGHKVWYDEFTIGWGDSLRRSIDEGLATSRYGIVILSKAFFAKEWAKRELDGLTTRESGTEKIILPIWHGVTRENVAAFSPILADRLALQSDRGSGELAAEVEKILNNVFDHNARSELHHEDSVPPSSRHGHLPAWEDHSTTTFFSDRMADAFPGVRGLRWFDEAEAMDRLQILFAEPLRFAAPDGSVREPFWWFRGYQASSISRFSVIGAGKCLMEHREVVVRRIGAYRADDYFRDFVYVEADGEETIGIYVRPEGYIDWQVKEYGYAREEYAIFNGHPITREEFDDGSAVIDGSVVRTRGAELRVRFLTPYNFIVAAKGSPYNSHQFEQISRKHMNAILYRRIELEQLIEQVLRIPRKRDEDI